MNHKKNTVLIIEDEPPIRKLLTITLEGNGFKAIDAENGQMGARMASSIKPELIILDMGLPDIDGEEVIQVIRQWSQVPIIVCSVRNNDSEVIKALELGADDYITKPFNPSVLLARVHANLRKSVTKEAGEPELVNGNIRMDLVRHEVFINNVKTEFTPKEYELLRYFMVNRGKMLTHKQILKDVWGPAHSDDMQYLRVYLSQIREKIEQSNQSHTYIMTEPGIGYRMEIIESDNNKENEVISQAALSAVS
ncbi:MAG: two component transcriptional regulator, winged helix family [Rickettsiaceae bacterium]|jgi:two-component system KDP operon response regulator KdpE|nr:two component transcriptional regulator, winged helix family [Rickettsiaceae bacterium]